METESWIYGEGELLADKISGLQGSISGLGQSGTSKISRVNFLPATDDEAHFTIGWHPFVSESHIIVDISLPSPLLESIIEEITLHPETELNVRIASDVFWFGVLSNHNWHLVGAVLKLITLDMEFEDRSEDQSLDHIMNEMNFRGGPVEVKISMVRSLRSSLEATSDNQSKEHSEKAEISAINGALASLHSEVRNLKRKYEDLQTAYNELSLKRSRRRC
ncbi:MAG: hypothetical protein CSA72_09705 [Rhodobacterales bacterium]|nr:MAG: hypothetical protein CSA72_09705 [Rhodobacterales bacterium]